MNHVRTLEELGALGGVVDVLSEKLYSFNKQYHDVQTFNSVEEALDYGFDGFIISTPPSTHYQIGKRILESGFPVLIEKPMTLDILDSEDLIKIAQDKRLCLMVGHVLLFHPAVQKIKVMIKEDKIGKLQYIYSNRLNLGQVRTEESVFWSLAPHDIAIFQYLTRSYPKTVKAHGSTYLQQGIHDSTLTILEYPDNVKGHIFVSWLHPFKEHRLVVIGSEGMLSFDDSSEGKPLKHYKKKFDLDGLVPVKIDGPMKNISYDDKMPLTEELKYFIDHLDDGGPEISNGNHALEVITILAEASKQLNE
jgi:UDP-2-acetamido-3-amino-2,3-dideoxy-glucuronate N-acetyltransferase